MIKPNLTLTVVLIILIEGVAIYLNMVAHPGSQPGLTIFIVLLMALIFGLIFWFRFDKSKEVNNMRTMRMSKQSLKYGMGFWIGAGVYSLINMFMNLKHADQKEILIYNFLITGVSICGLILNIMLLKKSK